MSRIIEIKECGPDCPYFMKMYMNNRNICDHPDLKLHGTPTFIDLLEFYDDEDNKFPVLCTLKVDKDE